MTAESTLAVVASAWGILMGLSPTLQIRQMLRTRSSRDFSVASFVVLNIGFLLWLSYGLAMGNLAVAIPNVVAFSVGVTTIVVARRLRQVASSSAVSPSSAVTSSSDASSVSV
ncbi:MAG: SemiSWEET family transporter [Ilumatobacteraceae bacterium]